MVKTCDKRTAQIGEHGRSESARSSPMNFVIEAKRPMIQTTRFTIVANNEQEARKSASATLQAHWETWPWWSNPVGDDDAVVIESVYRADGQNPDQSECPMNEWALTEQRAGEAVMEVDHDPH